MIYGGQRPLWQYVGFTGAGIVTSYLTAMGYACHEEQTKRRRKTSTSLFFGNRDTSNRLQTTWKYYRAPESMTPVESLQLWWSNGLRESEKTVGALVAVNVAVFLGWRIPRLQPLLRRYAMHGPRSNPASMLGATFSHRTIGHLAFNMMALWSFGTVLHDRIPGGREHFLAFYLSSGLASSCGSHLYRAWRIRKAASAAAAGIWDIPSLGASGAVLGIIGATTMADPDRRVGLILLPIHSVPIGTALPAMMAFDAVGLVSGWQHLDHAAHLAGAIYGYCTYDASRRVWARRHHIMRKLGVQ